MMSACSLHCGSMFVLNYVDPVMVYWQEDVSFHVGGQKNKIIFFLNCNCEQINSEKNVDDKNAGYETLAFKND